MPIKMKQKNNRKTKSKKRAVQNTAQSKIENRTSTIEVNVIPNMDNMNKSQKKSKKANRPKQSKVKVANSKKMKEQQPNKKKNPSKILKGIGIVLLVVGAIAFLCTTPLFNVTEIEVIGNANVSKEEIVSLSQIQLQENMFKNLKTTVKENIKGNAYIEDVKVKRVLPNKMQITVQERQIKFMVKLLESYAYINSQGYILEITKQTKEVPIIEGISTPEEEIIAGRRLNIDDLNRLEVALNIVSTCEENEISKYITSINIENINEYTVYMAEKLKTVHVGNNSNLGTKMLYVKAILQAEEGNEGEIFVNGDLNNGFQPFFRKKV